MAFSMFLRNPACKGRIFSQQLLRMASQPSLSQHTLTSTRQITNLLRSVETKTPNPSLLNAVRSFRTSPVRLSEVEKSHDHAKLWVIERAVAAILIPLVPLALMMPNKLFDSLLAIFITAHSFWGLEACVVEYFRVLVVGPVLPKVAMVVVYVMHVGMLGGLFYLTFNDIGVVRAFWKIWKNMRKPQDKTPPPIAPAPIPPVVPCKPKDKKGLEAIAVDYVRASLFGPVLPKVAIGLVYLISIATLGGLFYLISHDIGIANSIRQFWAIKSEQKA